MKVKILIDGFLDKGAILYLKKFFNVLVLKENNKKNLLKKIHNVEGIILKTTNLSNAELDCAKKLKVISRFGVGYDNLDLKYLKRKKISLRITAQSNKITVAEHVLNKMFFFYKKDYQNDKLARNRIFNEEQIYFGRDLYDSNILIFGYGRIAKELAKRCEALGMNIFVYDPFIKKVDGSKSIKIKFVKSYKKILKKMDVVSLHVPLNKNTYKFVDLNFFNKMKKNSIFINTSRGLVVNEMDLIKILKKNHLKIKFGLDVFEIEPPKKNNYILKSKDTFLTPHSATKTKECFKKMSYESVNNILNFFKKKDIKQNIVKL